MNDFFNALFDPRVVWILIPVVAIAGSLTLKGMKAHYAHKERIAKIEAGLEPDED